jgi:hypothetical protein
MQKQLTLGDYLTEGGMAFMCCHCRRPLARVCRVSEIYSNLMVHCTRCHRPSKIPMVIQRMERRDGDE